MFIMQREFLPKFRASGKCSIVLKELDVSNSADKRISTFRTAAPRYGSVSNSILSSGKRF